MNILALDTSTDATSVAVYADGKTTALFELTPRKHTDRLLPLVEELLAEAGIERGALDYVAFGRGPGSFTGVRIATSVAQGIAFSVAAQIVPVSTLAALAQEEMERSGADRVMPVVDARMKEVYTAHYVKDENGIAQLQGDEHVCPPAAVPLPGGSGWVSCGSGWAVYGEELAHRLGGIVEPVEGEGTNRQPRAEYMLKLARLGIEQGFSLPPEQGLPVYLRDKVAETTDERKRRKSVS